MGSGQFIWDDTGPAPEPGSDQEPAAEAVPIHGLSKRQLAAALGKPLRTVDKLCRDGLPCRSAGSRAAGLRFDLPVAIEWIAAHRAAEAGGEASDALAQAKIAKAKAEAAKLERANAQAAGELVPLAELEREIAEGMAALRSTLLAIPARLTEHAPEMRASVKAEIVAAINGFAITHCDSGGDHADS